MRIERHPLGNPRSLDSELRRALELARASDIARPIQHSFPAGTPLSEIGTVDHAGHCVVPLVTERGRVFGWVNPGDLSSSDPRASDKIGALAHRIGIDQVVTGSTPALEALYMLDDDGSRIWVISGRDIDHELVFEDFDDSLVRLSLLGVLIILEEAIDQTAGSSEDNAAACLALLDEGQRKNARRNAQREHADDEVSTSEVFSASSFSEKRDVVAKLPEVFGFDRGDADVALGLNSAVKVRNALGVCVTGGSGGHGTPLLALNYR